MAKPNPSFLKRQKEQARKEKAEAKRTARADKKNKPAEPEEELKPLSGPAPIEDDL